MKNKLLFFDTGPLISLVMSGLIEILPRLKERFSGIFYITPAVKRELIERPLQIRRFEFEALRALKLIKEGVLQLYEEVPYQKVAELERLADSSFKIKNKNLDLVQAGEMEVVASALKTKAEAVVMDERTLRLFIEHPSEMKRLLEHRFRKKVTPNYKKIKKFYQQLKGIKIIRSIELVAVAYKLGFLKEYTPPLKKGKKILLEAVLWGTKYSGCAVTQREIEETKEFLLKTN